MIVGFLVLSSDSSMDDCNVLDTQNIYGGGDVQIPLWTIVTAVTLYLYYVVDRSDSSMDDCNLAPAAG